MRGIERMENAKFTKSSMRGVSASVLFVCCIVASLLLTANAYAVPPIEFGSSLNPVGSGARATGMGGAFIGVADDATAASWNPAGLVNLEKPEVSVVYSYFSRKQSYSGPSTHQEIDSTNHMDANGLNYASAAYPFVLLDRNMVVSLNYQRLFEMNKNVDFNYNWGGGLSGPTTFEQEGYLYALSPAMAVQVVPKLYLGATLNFWGDYLGDNGWDTNTTVKTAGGGATLDYFEKSNFSFKGFNANLGLLWKVSGPFKLGIVYKVPFTAKVRKESSNYNVLNNVATATVNTVDNMKMEMPASYGVGVSYRPSDNWTMALDIYRTQWSDFHIRDSNGNKINPITAEPWSEGGLDDTTQLRLGTEYLFIKEKSVVPLRAGLFYDPEPARGGLDNHYGLSLGTGYSNKKLSFDASYQYRFGRNGTGDLSSINTLEGSGVDMDQHTLMLSVIYYF